MNQNLYWFSYLVLELFLLLEREFPPFSLLGEVSTCQPSDLEAISDIQQHNHRYLMKPVMHCGLSHAVSGDCHHQGTLRFDAIEDLVFWIWPERQATVSYQIINQINIFAEDPMGENRRMKYMYLGRMHIVLIKLWNLKIIYVNIHQIWWNCNVKIIGVVFHSWVLGMRWTITCKWWGKKKEGYIQVLCYKQDKSTY